MALTKSLHTVTATVNVARLLIRSNALPDTSAETAVRYALDVLGYDVTAFGFSDPTVAAILRQVSKMVQA